MSALAQFQAMLGGTATGSDRVFDRGEAPGIRRALERVGVRIVAQDGTGVRSGCDALIVSTAVEESVPDVRAAREAAIPVIHRSELLARLVAARRTVAVAGTSGKSTVVAMVFELARGAGLDPSLVSGGDLKVLADQGYLGNAWAGASDLLVIEADESDGSLIRYAPAIGVVLNLDKDHKEVAEVRAMFDAFRQRTRESFVVGEGENLAHLRSGALVFGTGGATAAAGGLRGEEIRLFPDASEFTAAGINFRVPVPGLHNVENALAALATGTRIGLTLAAMAEPLAGFRGVHRRFETLGVVGGVEVIDDFAHNPAKLKAAIAAARLRRPGHILVVFQPHGFGPTRFLRADLVEAFCQALNANDRLWLLEIFYAGGTVTRDLSAADLVQDLRARGVQAEFAAGGRAALAERLAETAKPGDLILIVGARDPTLTELGHAALARIQDRHAAGK
jgi:UDP-N-acetylmuramate--alanine ligase